MFDEANKDAVGALTSSLSLLDTCNRVVLQKAQTLPTMKDSTPASLAVFMGLILDTYYGDCLQLPSGMFLSSRQQDPRELQPCRTGS